MFGQRAGKVLLGLWLIGGTLAPGQTPTEVAGEKSSAEESNPLSAILVTLPAEIPLPPLPVWPCPLSADCEIPVPPPPLDPPAPHVTVKVRVAACAPEEKELEYRICLENCSPAAAHHVLLRNPLPANATFVRANPEPSQTKPELQWQLGTMHGGERRTVVLVLAPLGAGDVKNCTRVQFEHGQCVTTRLGARMPPADGVPAVGKVTLTMTGPKQQYLNLPAQYFLTVTNTGKTPATNILLTAQVPDKLTFDKASAKGQFAEGQAAWVLGDLQPGQSRTVELVLKAQAAGNFCVRADVLADGNLRDKAELCTDFRGISALSLEMVDTRDPVVVGEETSFTIQVLNTGSAPATNVQIRALVPDAMNFQQAKGAEFQLGDKTPDGAQSVIFQALPSLAAGAKLDLAVTARALRAGDTRFTIFLTADQLERGPVREDESTTIINEDGPAR